MQTGDEGFFEKKEEVEEEEGGGGGGGSGDGRSRRGAWSGYIQSAGPLSRFHGEQRESESLPPSLFLTLSLAQPRQEMRFVGSGLLQSIYKEGHACLWPDMTTARVRPGMFHRRGLRRAPASVGLSRLWTVDWGLPAYFAISGKLGRPTIDGYCNRAVRSKRPGSCTCVGVSSDSLCLYACSPYLAGPFSGRSTPCGTETVSTVGSFLLLLGNNPHHITWETGDPRCGLEAAHSHGHVTSTPAPSKHRRSCSSIP